MRRNNRLPAIAGQAGTDVQITPAIPSRRIRILADTGYSSMLSDCDCLQDEIQRRFGKWTARIARFSSIRGMLAWWIAREYDFVVTVSHWPGGRWLVFLTAWLAGRRRRKIILLEFISCPERLINRLLFTVWFPLVFRPAIRRTMVAAQVMAAAEPDYYSNIFGLPPRLFHLIPLPLIEDKVQDPGYHASNDVVFASGRAALDWETLFRAAEGAKWNLWVVSSKHDRKRVDRLNRDGRANVRSEIPTAEHAQMMEKAAVYVLPLRQRPISCGQLRMRNAISAGIPIVCTRVDGLRGYAIDDQTAAVVDEGDSAALRREIDKLLFDPEWRRTLATRARELARTRTAAWFSTAINEFVHRVATSACDQTTSLTPAQSTMVPEIES